MHTPSSSSQASTPVADSRRRKNAPITAVHHNIMMAAVASVSPIPWMMMMMSNAATHVATIQPIGDLRTIAAAAAAACTAAAAAAAAFT